MPNTRSAKKALRQNRRRYIRNRAVRQRIKRWTKKLMAIINEGSKEKAEQVFSFLTKLLDKAAKRNIIHKNKANRKKSRLQRLINAL